MTTKMDILIAGVTYCCKDEEECQATLRHLAEKRPKILLVTERNADYGLVVRALEGRRKRGVVCRCDLDAVLSLMQETGEEMLVGHAVNVNVEGGCYTVRLDCEGELRPARSREKVWDAWEWTGARLLSELPGERDTEQCFKVLRSVMRHPELLSDEEVAEHLDLLVEAVRWDVSEETQQMLYRLRTWLVEHTSATLHGYYDRLVHAILAQGSEKRLAAFEEVYYPMLCASRANGDMLSCWYSNHAQGTLTGSEAVATMEEQLTAIDECLRLLPEKLYDHTRHFGRLMSRLLYMHIPRKKLEMLLSAILLRDDLEGEMEGEWAEAAGDWPETPPSNGTAEEPTDEEEEEGEGGLTEQLLPIFFYDRKRVETFLQEIGGMKPREITMLVNRKLKEKIISSTSCHRELWTILHEAGLYTCSESNWNKRVL